MGYIILTILLFFAIISYFRVANHYNIIDQPNHRSSHSITTLRGGGIIFWFTSATYFVQHIDDSYWFFVAITLISFVSFWDDIQNLPNTIRISAHFIAISLIFFDLDIFSLFSFWGIALTYVVAIGVLNAYNFMDGINGITGLYTLVVMGFLWLADRYVQHFVDIDLVIYPILASLVFLFFNFRKNAKCFAGDVGSIAIAFWIIFLLLKLILATGSLTWILFLAVYGIDTVCTILHRLYLKQNIFKAHRMHFYQVLSNEYGIQHRIVSILYAGMQAIVSSTVILSHMAGANSLLSAIILLPLLLIYSLKFRLIRRKV